MPGYRRGVLPFNAGEFPRTAHACIVFYECNVHQNTVYVLYKCCGCDDDPGDVHIEVTANGRDFTNETRAFRYFAQPVYPALLEVK